MRDATDVERGNLFLKLLFVELKLKKTRAHGVQCNGLIERASLETELFRQKYLTTLPVR